jgi:hypothetical protein
MSNWLVTIIGLAAFALQPFAVCAASFSTRQDSLVTKAITDFQSSDFRKQGEAKRQLLSAGSEAVDPLVSLLSQLLDQVAENRNPLKDAQHPRTNETQKPVYSTENWRLIIDCCDLLGKLRAARAVSLLIRVIEVHETFGTLPKRVAEVIALELIGKPAEPALMRELRDAPHRAVDLAGFMLSDGDPEKTRVQDVKALEIRIQVGAVLSRIGDEQTIVALQSMLQTKEFVAGSGRDIIEQTISQIRQRAFPLR